MSLPGRLLVVTGVLELFMLIVIFGTHITEPRVGYSLQKLDCNKEAILERNQAKGFQQDACIIIIKVSNLENKRVILDLDGVGGGPFTGWHPQLKIHARNGNFCYAGVGDDELEAYETRDLTLLCFGNQEKKPNYDIDSDQQPLYIEIYHDPPIKLYPSTTQK